MKSAWLSLEMAVRDTLFFRDARPMESGDTGHGAAWPLPSVLHEAMHAAMRRRWPHPQPWEEGHLIDYRERGASRSQRKLNRTGMRFGALSTMGPLPVKAGQLYAPTPADLVPVDKGIATLVPDVIDGASDLPSPLQLGLHLPAGLRPNKRRRPAWLAWDALRRYLVGAPFDAEDIELFDTESRPGIAINALSGTTEEGAFFSTEFLRLRPGVGLWASARCPLGETDAVARLLGEADPCHLILGGEGGAGCLLQSGEFDHAVEDLRPAAAGPRVKWLLLSPAVFENRLTTDDPVPQGWLPNWVSRADGRVHLPLTPPARDGFASRPAWREAVRAMPPIEARLVAACVPRPLVFSGWDTAIGGPKATRLAVQAGSVYYFDCGSTESAAQLIEALHGRCRSDVLAEKGFGLGVCGTWETKPRSEQA